MNKPDLWVKMILGALLLVHLVVWICGHASNRLVQLSNFVNPGVALLILSYWGINQLQISRHFIEGREIVVLAFEALVVAGSLYGIISQPHYKWFAVVQYIVFGIHLACIICGLIFMFFFRINRLF